MSRFTAGTVVVVTGGGGGLGAEICYYLAREGALVVVADIDVAAAHQVVGDIGDSGGRAVAVEVDVARRDEMEGLVAGVVRDHGRLDLLVNNAAIGLDGEFRDMTLEDWDQVFATDVWSVVVGTHFAYQVMLEQGGGQIVNVSSLAGLLPGGLMTSYVASKHAVVGLTLGLRAEARQYGIRVNALCPGFVETAIHDRTRKVSAYLEADAMKRDRSRFPTAADVIGPLMRGVERDRAIVVAPRSHALFWYLYRLAPSSIPFMWSMIIRRIKRRARH